MCARNLCLKNAFAPEFSSADQGPMMTGKNSRVNAGCISPTEEELALKVLKLECEGDNSVPFTPGNPWISGCTHSTLSGTPVDFTNEHNCERMSAFYPSTTPTSEVGQLQCLMDARNPVVGGHQFKGVDEGAEFVAVNESATTPALPIEEYATSVASMAEMKTQRSEFLGSLGNKIEHRFLVLMTFSNALLKIYKSNVNWGCSLSPREVDERIELILKVRSEFFRLKGVSDRERQSSRNRVMYTKRESETIAESMMSIEWEYSREIWSILSHSIDLIERECMPFDDCRALMQMPLMHDCFTLQNFEKCGTTEKSFTPFPYEVTGKLLAFYVANQYPTRQEKRQLANETGLTLGQVNSWFSNKRTRQRKVVSNCGVSIDSGAASTG